jgi:hypothetical protein
VAAQLADVGARQGLPGEREVGQALVGRKLLREPIEIRAHAPRQARRVALAQRPGFRHEEADQAALVLEDRDLVHQRALAQHLLDLVREHVLAAREDDHLLAAADEMQIAVGIDEAEIAGAEEAVLGEGLTARLGVLPITREDVRPARQNLAALAFALLDVLDAQLDARHRQPRALDAGAARRVEGEDGRGLGQAVAGQNLESQRLEAPPDLGLEAGAAGRQQAKLGPELAPKRREH